MSEDGMLVWLIWLGGTVVVTLLWWLRERLSDPWGQWPVDDMLIIALYSFCGWPFIWPWLIWRYFRGY